MNLKDLTDKIAEEMGCTKKDALELVRAFLGHLASEIAEQGKVSLAGFGTFRVIVTSPRKGWNPHTGESVGIPAKKRVRFKPALRLRERLAA